MDIQTTTPFMLVTLLVLLLPLTGALMAATPYLMPKRECFAVTVPDAAAADPYLRRLKRTYAIGVLLLTALFTAAAAVAFLMGGEGIAIGVFIAGTLAVPVCGYALMLRFRSKVRAYKRQRGWEASASLAAGFVGAEDIPHALSLRWDLLYLPLIAVTLLIGIALYPDMPARIPQNIDLQGNVTNWMDKSIGAVLFPALLVAFLGLCMTAAHWSIVRSKRPTDPAMPAASAWAYGMFARAQSFMLVAGGLALGLIGPVMELSFGGAISIGAAAAVSLLLVFAMVAAWIGISVVYGQNGARLLTRMSEADSMPSDDDRYWKLGIFYYNPDDASLFLPERFGIGWTLNWGRRAAWALLIGGIAVVALFIGGIAVLIG